MLSRHKPKIVAITGSVGKTSAKAAVFTVLSQKFHVRENLKNYNNEIGIPLTIIGAQSGGRNIFKWVWIFVKWIFVIIFPGYPKILILELGVDRPEDMKYFMSFIHPMVSVVTNISSSHVEYFKTVDNIAKEKRVIIESLGADDFAVLNADDEKVSQMKTFTKAQVMTFGEAENADVNASHILYNYQDNKPEGITFKLNFDGKNIPVRLRNILAAHQVSAALVGVSVGTIFKMNLVDIAMSLENLRPPVGRMNLLEGIEGSYIIDDTYNASPVSTMAALDVLAQLKGERKIAVLGDMLELGNHSEIGHKEVARKIFALNIDVFLGVGKRMEAAERELISMGFPASNILHAVSPEEAALKMEKIASSGDFILVKGSQGMRMEKITEKLLKTSSEAKNLLCRQTPEWKKKSFLAP